MILESVAVLAVSVYGLYETVKLFEWLIEIGSYNSGIYWCNTSSGKKTLNSFGSIADGAQAVHDKCLDPDGQFCWVRGRASHTTNWNVLVTGQQC